MGRWLKRILIGLLLIVIAGLFIPQNLTIPVKGAKSSDYNHQSYWYYPWGRSVTHKGVDIFAKKGKAIHSSTIGIVVFTGELPVGGKYVLILGPKWRWHYYAHLDELKTSSLTFVGQSSVIGTVGTSGNAAGKPPHLHYAIVTTLPYLWRADNTRQGWKKMFYLNPIDYLNND